MDDYLVSTYLNLNGSLDDGWGALLPAKGREIEATILFADIAGFSRRTLDLTPAETLIFVNQFFAWMTAEALEDTHGIIDKYIGDEIMVVFSREFGSEDPFAEALTSAKRMGDYDAFSFCPHIGIASGQVIVGYVGTPRRYSCSVFGAPVAVAARCAGVRMESDDNEFISSTIAFPAAEWGSRDFDVLFPPHKIQDPLGNVIEQPHAWKLSQVVRRHFRRYQSKAQASWIMPR